MSKNTISQARFFSALEVFAAFAFLGFAHNALAAPESASVTASTFGDLLCNAVNNGKQVHLIFEWVAYISGVISALRGIHLLRMHADDPKNNKLGTPLMFLAGALGLLALPSFISMVEKSLLVPAAGGGFACQAGPVAAHAEGLENVLTNFITNFKDPLLTLISLVAVLAGLFFIVRGLIKASKYGTDPRTHSMHSILTNIGFGALLMTIGDNMNMMLASTFGEHTSMANVVIGWQTVKHWHAVDVLGASDSFAKAIASALTFVQIIGAIAFVRGWLVLKKVVEGGSNETLTKGLTHIIGGVLALNISGFLQLMDKTFGTGLLGP